VRILYLSGESVPGADGGSVHTRAVAEGLAGRGHEVTLLTRTLDGPAKEAVLPGVRLLRTPMRLGRRTAPLMALPSLMAMGAGRFDVIMARFSAFGGGEGIYASRAGIPLVLEVNSPQVAEVCWRYGLEGRAAGELLEAWGRSQFSRAARIITPTLRIVPEEDRARARRVTWACDTDRFRPLAPGRAEATRARLGLSGRIVVAFSGSFRSWHGVDALPALARLLPEAAFLCLGDGDRFHAVQAEAARLGVSDAFRFVGKVPPEGMPDLLGAAHAGIAPFQVSAYPPFARFGFFYSPLKIFEYMASGLPVVATRCPELAAIVQEGVTGRLVPEGDLEALAAALRDLPGDMGRAARIDAEARFSWAAHAAGLERILKEAIHAGGV